MRGDYLRYSTSDLSSPKNNMYFANDVRQIQLVEYLNEPVSSKGASFVDPKSVFNTVSRDKGIIKLERSGVPPRILQLLARILEARFSRIFRALLHSMTELWNTSHFAKQQVILKGTISPSVIFRSSQ